jgi:hypothetical protein
MILMMRYVKLDTVKIGVIIRDGLCKARTCEFPFLISFAVLGMLS